MRARSPVVAKRGESQERRALQATHSHNISPELESQPTTNDQALKNHRPRACVPGRFLLPHGLPSIVNGLPSTVYGLSSTVYGLSSTVSLISQRLHDLQTGRLPGRDDRRQRAEEQANGNPGQNARQRELVGDGEHCPDARHDDIAHV